jgi:O-antigen/teichoic acid export membrane protein
VYPASQSLQTRPRLLLIVLLVELGLAVPGAILGSIGASLADIPIGRCYIRPTPFHRPRCATRQLWDYAVPLFLAALSLRLYEKLDLFALKALGATAEQAGMYGAVQSLALVPGIFALAFSPLLLATLSRTLRAGDSSLAREISRDALRVPLVLLPFAGLTAGAAHEIIGLIFGAAFLPATPLLALLIFAAVALVMLSVVTAILTAADKPGWTFVLTGPLVLLALIGHLLLIPRLGATGAALVTTLVAALGALLAVLAVYRLWRVLPPAATFWRSVLVCGVAYALAAVWVTPGWLLLLKLAGMTLLIPLFLLWLDEFHTNELAFIRSLLWSGLEYRKRP